MFTSKYFDKIAAFEDAEGNTEPSPDFDLSALASTGFKARIGRFLFDHSLFFLGLARTLKPIASLGDFTLVTRYDDVRQVLDADDVFHVPFGREMRTLSGGADFVLGMQRGPDYEALKEDLADAFRDIEAPGLIASFVKPLAEQQVASCGDRLDVMRDLVMATAANICRGYYGIDIADDVAFSEWSIACSMLLFADPSGDPKTRATARSGAKYLRDAINAAIRAAHAGDKDPDTVVARLVAHQQSGATHLDDKAIRALLFGMIAGFIPTNVLAAGNILSMLLSRRDMLAAAQAAARDDDDARLEAVLFEALRFKAPLNPGVMRVVDRDYVVAEGTSRATLLKKGRTVFVATQSAMFDSRKFSNPGAFQPDRPELRAMVFGHGLHWCIGAPIAKAHITHALKPLLKRERLRSVGSPSFVGPFQLSHVMRFKSGAIGGEQSLVTVCLPLEADRLAATKALIEKLGNPASPDVAARLRATGCIHFMSLNAIDTRAMPAGSVLDAKPEDGGIYLVLEMSTDGRPRDVFKALVDAIGQQLLPIFAACGVESEAGLVKTLVSSRLNVTPLPFGTLGIGYQGTPGMSVRRILDEDKLEESSRGYLSDFNDAKTAQRQRQAAAGATADEAPSAPSAVEAIEYVRNRLRADAQYWCFRPAGMDFVRPGAQTSLVWPIIYATLGILGFAAVAALPIAALLYWAALRVPGPCPTQLACGLTVFGHALLAEFLAFLLVFTALAVAIWLLYRNLRRQETTDQPLDKESSADNVAAILSHENAAAQNHMTAVSHIKAGPVRRLALRLVFAVVWFAVVSFFRRGYLSDIGTIHFARWFSPKGTRKLFFFSNYDGSWESYLEDFITLAHAGLTAVWSNTLDFPKTNNLFFNGAEDGDRFKRWARRQQIPTQFWFTAYPDLTTDRIRTNAEIRYGLATARSESLARAWMDLFGSLPRPRVMLETEDIQSILFGGFGKLDAGACLLVRFAPAQRESAATWLRHLAEHVTFGDVNPSDKGLVFAVSAAGLEKLGLPELPASENGLASFPPAFRLGMSHPARARVLGDAPSEWNWGSDQSPVDAVLLVYATTRDDLKTRLATEQGVLDGLDLRHEAITLKLIRKPPHGPNPDAAPVYAVQDGRKRKNPNTYEPFGFVDGISQPVIRGTQRYYKGTPALHTANAGEFILGYPDNRGYFPPTPMVHAADDPRNILPSPPSQLPERWPEFASGREAANQIRDLGRNGSYLVIRQLAQDVAGFHAAVQEQASTHPSLSARTIAAKIVGRWEDGSSLTRNPAGIDGRPQDNDFLHGVEDPQGLRCPLGAHVRRAYPRDSFRPGREDEIAITNRHRLLRIGRPYLRAGAPPTAEPEGLLFMCLNADIERQFEFVQQTWVNAPSIHTLRNDIDPIASTSAKLAKFTIPQEAGAVELPQMRSFIKVIGGGYFFLPGRQALRYLGRLC
jgi:cytochrome P450/deferrochelatase/peroxidase EfeB